MEKNIEWKKITANQLLKEFRKECEKMNKQELYDVTKGLFTTQHTLREICKYRYGNEKRICDLMEYLNIAQDTYLRRFMNKIEGTK